MNDSKMNSKAICILGMHRSGTSVITRAINLLGAYIGEESELMVSTPNNPEGYWERNDIAKLNDAILHHFKKSWDANYPLPEGWQKLEEVKPFKNKIIELVKKYFSGHQLWAWKDPRSTILFEIWKDALGELGINLICLFVVRNPLDVAKSLKRRDGFSHNRSFGIWFYNNITALKATRDIPRVFVSYDKFLADWETELRRCATVFEIVWPFENSILKERMKKIIRPELRRSFSGLNELKEVNAPSQVVKLYSLLMGVANSSMHPDDLFNHQVERLSEEFLYYSCFYQDDLIRLWGLEKILHGKDRQIDEKDRQIEAMLNSFSWRITAPLRWLYRLLTKETGK